MSRFKFGICEWALPENGKHGCRITRMMGLDGMSLDLGDEQHSFPKSIKENQEIYLDEAQKWEIEYTAMAVNAVGKYSMVAPAGSEEYKMAKWIVRSAIDACDAMKIRIVQIPSTLKSEIITEENFQRTANFLRDACDYAESKSIIIASENLLSSDEILRLFGEIARDNVRLYFDSQNYKLAHGYNSAEIFRKTSHHVCEIHIKDGIDNWSTHLLGEGNSEFFETAKAISKSNYNGWIMLENYYDQPPLCVDRNPFELMKKDLSTVKEVFMD